MEALLSRSDLRKIAALSFLLLINFGVIFSKPAMAETIDDNGNNNRPVFIKHEYEVAVKLPAPISSVIQVEAMDKDAGENGKLGFKIESGSDEFFRITQSGSIMPMRNLDEENLRLFNMTVSVSDQGTPPLTAGRPAHVCLLVFQPLEVPIQFLEGTTYTSVKVQFDLKFMDIKNVAKYGIIIQQSNHGDSRVVEYSEREPLTWNEVFGDKQDGPRRYIAAIIQSNAEIEATRRLEFEVGTDEDCNQKKEKDEYCNGPLTAGDRYRFQLRAYVKDPGPFMDLSYKDSKFSRCVVEMPPIET